MDSPIFIQWQQWKSRVQEWLNQPENELDLLDTTSFDRVILTILAIKYEALYQDMSPEIRFAVTKQHDERLSTVRLSKTNVSKVEESKDDDQAKLKLFNKFTGRILSPQQVSIETSSEWQEFDQLCKWHGVAFVQRFDRCLPQFLVKLISMTSAYQELIHKSAIVSSVPGIASQVYRKNNVGEIFLSIDMESANFTMLQHIHAIDVHMYPTCIMFRGRGRGRGTSRGRGGRGASRDRGRVNTRGNFRERSRFIPPQSMDIEQQTIPVNPPVDLDINVDAKPFFVNANVTVDQHIQAQTTNLLRYLASLFALNENSVEIGQKAEACVLAAAWGRHDHKLANDLLRHRHLFTLTEVLKAVTMLDAGRQIRVYEKQLKRLELSKTKCKATKLGKIKNNIDNLNKLKVSNGSASGGIARHIQRWTRTLTQQELEYFALHMPTEPWRKLADIVHFNPTKDFPALPWFLPFCFGTPAPEETMVNRCRDLTAVNINNLIKEFKIPYSHLKQFKEHLNDESKARIASYEEKVDTILWYYEDLECPDVDEIISERIRNGERITLPYGKLMDRLLLIRTLRDNQPDIPTFYRNNEYNRGRGRGRGRGFGNVNNQHSLQSKKSTLYSDLISVAEAQLQTIKLPLESPVGVLADASYSMEIAIRTATILSSLLTAICSAKLTFFHGEMFLPSFTPKNVEDVLTLALTTNVGGGTANAAALLPYYLNKEIIKTFIMVTDEEENESIELIDGTKTRFFKLFMKYREEVYPAKLVFISFLAHQHDQGQMYKQFQEANVPDVTQFKFNRERPDLTKLDNLLGLLSTGSSGLFEDRVGKLQNDFQQDGVSSVLMKLLNNQDENAVPMESEITTATIN
ncbi:unnamed protein product [Adineta steineri]|uniref:Uncharacterized protein n=2 Tax=Adineta steineri TaxID=433720 RepID=A0A819FGE6_9BILA|nr:unnamed protein product [Adineta steineri]